MKQNSITKTPAGLVRRLLASMLDAICAFVIGYILLLLMSRSSQLELLANSYGVIVAQVVILLYYAWFESSGWRATPGKKVLRLIVEREDGRRLHFLRAALRYVIYITIPLIIGVYMKPIYTQVLLDYSNGSSSMHNVPPETLNTWLRISLGYLVYLIIWNASFFFTKDKLVLHDIFSGTKVVYLK